MRGLEMELWQQEYRERHEGQEEQTLPEVLE